MTLHLLKAPVSPVALQMLSAQASAQASPPVVVLLPHAGKPPVLPKCTLYRIAENNLSQSNDIISYDRLVTMLFASDRVITW
jgi:hypothetical protein